MNPPAADTFLEDRVWNFERQHGVHALAALGEQRIQGFRLDQGARKSVEDEPGRAVRLLQGRRGARAGSGASAPSEASGRATVPAVSAPRAHLDTVLDDADDDIIADERAGRHERLGLLADLGAGCDGGAVARWHRAW